MSAVDDEPPRNGLAYRLLTLEQNVSRLFSYEPAVQRQRIDQHDKDISDVDKRVDQVVEELRSVRRALYTLALTVASVGVAAIVTALQIAGG